MTPASRARVGYPRAMSVTAARLALLLTLALLYGTLGVARVVAEWLRAENLLRVSVGLAFGAAILVVARVLRSARALPGFYRSVLGVAAFYALVLSQVDRPEEKLHFLQYGLVGLLARRSLPAGLAAPPSRGVVVAVGVTLLAGWLDEGIQGLLPTRHYDPRDVVMNTLAGALALGAEAMLLPRQPPRTRTRSFRLFRTP